MDTTKYGLFSEGSYITSGDPYEKKDKKVVSPTDTRTKGKQLVTSPPKRGRTNETFFDHEFRSLYVGEKYMDDIDRARMWEKSESKKMVSSQGFKPSSASKQSCGSGSFFGTFGGKVEYLSDGRKARTREDAEKMERLKPFVTSPPKKGTYGFPSTTVGPFPEYASEQYMGASDRETAERKKEREMTKGKKFMPSSSGCQLFDGNIYKLDKEMPPKKGTKKVVETANPFRPTSPGKKGPMGTISKMPEYQSSPYDAMREMEKKERSKEKDTKAFRPVSGMKTRMTRSIAYGRPHIL